MSHFQDSFSETVREMSNWGSPRASGRALGVAYAEYERAHMALVAEVSLDRVSGEIAVHRVWSAVDCGFALQPGIIQALMEGGITQGLSIALYEEVVVEDGVFQQSNYHDYRILRMSETPEIEVKVLDSDRDVAGAAELGIMTIAPAVSNAIYRISGKRPDHLPMTPERIKML